VKRNDFKAVLHTSAQLQIWLHLFLLEGLSADLKAVEREAIAEKFTAETADHLDILHCCILEIIQDLKEL